MPNEIAVVFHRGSNYDCHFIHKKFANQFEGKFECLGENKEKYKTFSFPMKKEITKIDKDILLIISQKEPTNLNAKTVIVFLNMKLLRTI